jgi:dTDP-4-dehydrorhamnose 3,5-epimerase
VRQSEILGLVVLRMKQVEDGRGTIREFFRASAMAEAGLWAGPWRQVNITRTVPGAVRGLHGEAMTKLVCVVAGEAFGAYHGERMRPQVWPSAEQVGAPLMIKGGVTGPVNDGQDRGTPLGVLAGFGDLDGLGWTRETQGRAAHGSG